MFNLTSSRRAASKWGREHHQTSNLFFECYICWSRYQLILFLQGSFWTLDQQAHLFPAQISDDSPWKQEAVSRLDPDMENRTQEAIDLYFSRHSHQVNFYHLLCLDYSVASESRIKLPLFMIPILIVFFGSIKFSWCLFGKNSLRKFHPWLSRNLSLYEYSA